MANGRPQYYSNEKLSNILRAAHDMNTSLRGILVMLHSNEGSIMSEYGIDTPLPSLGTLIRFAQSKNDILSPSVIKDFVESFHSVEEASSVIGIGHTTLVRIMTGYTRINRSTRDKLINAMNVSANKEVSVPSPTVDVISEMQKIIRENYILRAKIQELERKLLVIRNAVTGITV